MAKRCKVVKGPDRFGLMQHFFTIEKVPTPITLDIDGKQEKRFFLIVALGRTPSNRMEFEAVEVVSFETYHNERDKGSFVFDESGQCGGWIELSRCD